MVEYPSVTQMDIRNLTGFGFQRHSVFEALRASDGKIGKAYDILISKGALNKP